jgi:hypothetical protein
MPGSGKSTVAEKIRTSINEAIPHGAVVLSMDGKVTYVPIAYTDIVGFHYYRKELDAFDDPVTAHARRGRCLIYILYFFVYVCSFRYVKSLYVFIVLLIIRCTVYFQCKALL